MSLDAWHDLFLAVAGAGSALAGLIIVAISVNITTIIKTPSMVSRAATAVAGLVLIVVVATAALIPGQPASAWGIESAVAAAVVLALAVRSSRLIVLRRPAGVDLAFAAGKAALGIVPTAVLLVGGAFVCADLRGGVYTIAAAMIVTFATSTTNAWVLLVEILR